MRPRLRVALVGPCPRDLRHAFGGVDAVVALLARLLVELDVEVTVLTCDFEARADEIEEREGVSLHRLASGKTGGRLTFYARDRARLRERLRALAPDVAHVHGTDFYADAVTRHAGPVLLTVHGVLARERNDFEGVSFAARLPRAMRARANARFERRALARARDVVVLNGYVRAAIEGATRARVHEIPNPIDPAYFDVPDRTVPDRLLFVGAIRPRKGLLHLIRALPRVLAARPGVRLHVVGRTTDEAYGRAARDAVASDGLAQAVEWRGPLSASELLDEFAGAAAIVLPSVEESSPLVAAQAMAAGKPVVAHAVGGIPHLVEEGTTGALAPFGDGDALAAAIVRVLADEPRRRALGAAGAGIARARFEPRRVAERTASLYRELVARGGAGGRGETPAS